MTSAAVGSAALQIGLLGPVVVLRDGAEVPLGSRMQRGTLALLALGAGEAVTAARLSEGLWGAHPPTTAAGTLRAYLSRLRTSLGADALQRTPGGYVLAVAPEDVDAVRFEALVEQAQAAAVAQPAEALAVLRRAQDMWRGDVLADVAGLPFAGQVISRMREQRRETDVLGWRLQLALGEHGNVLDELQAAATRDPGHEDLVGLLLVALYRSGRQSEALQRFVALREHLAEEQGIDPGPQTRRLHQSILAQDPGLLRGDPLAAAGAEPSPPPTTAGDGGTGSAPVPVGDAAATTAGPLQRPLRADGDVPSVPGDASPRTNLPVPLSSFVGRAPQLQILDRMIATSRLVTLTGAGGVGKTRLAVEAARRAGARATEGPWMVELAEISEDSLVASAVCQSVGILTAGGVAADVLVTALRGRETVLLLDNCEHVVQGVADLVGVVLGACPDVRIIATSREPLGIPGEHVLVIPSLPAEDAAALFAERAVLVAPGFSLEGPSGEQVLRVCSALDGIPLAIELAAARLSALSLDHISSLMDDRFALLGHPSRSAVARHRTLAAAIGWSYDPSSPAERDLLHAAAAFPGGFTLEALAVVAGRDLGQVAGGLTALVDKSMVSVVDEGSQRRYRVLETIRQYCADQAGDAVVRDLAERHAAWVDDLAADIAERYVGTEVPWRDATTERGNIRAALAHCDATADVPRMLRIAGNLSWAWFRLGQVAESNQWMERVMGHVARLGVDGLDARDLAQMLIGRTLGAYLGGDLDTAGTAIREAAEAADRAADPVLQSISGIYLAYFHAAFEPAEAVIEADAILAQADARDVPQWVHAEIDMVRGQLRRAQGRHAEALAALERSQAVADVCGHGYIWGSSGWIKAKLLLDMGDAVQAGAGLAVVVRRLAAQGDRSSTLAVLHTMAAIAAPLGRLYEGGVLLGAVDALGGAIGYHPLQMDAIDAPRHRQLVTDALPVPVLERALAEGAGYSIRQAVALAVRVGSTPARSER